MDGREIRFASLESSGGTEQHAYIVQDSRGDSHDEDLSDGGDQGVLREQDRFLPIANVARIMKKAIPQTGKIAKDARECCQECVSEFISFITSEASDRCQAEKRKTINGEDILFAMSTLGFDNYVEPLKLYLQKYREATKGDKQSADGYDDLGEDMLGGSTLQSIEHQGGNQVLITYGGAANIQGVQGFQLG